MNRLDGNAAAGALADLFHEDLTTATGRCAGCGATAALAEAACYASAMGDVLRCPFCDRVLAVVVAAEGRVRLSLPGLTGVALDD